MADPSTAFVGAVPANYDRHLGPILFHHYADDLVARLSVTPGMRVLETACGTGIVTRRLVDRLGGRGSLVATDLNQAMIDQARTRLPNDAMVDGKRRTPRACPSPIGRSTPSCASSASCSSRTRPRGFKRRFAS